MRISAHAVFVEHCGQLFLHATRLLILFAQALLTFRNKTSFAIVLFYGIGFIILGCLSSVRFQPLHFVFILSAPSSQTRLAVLLTFSSRESFFRQERRLP